MVADREGATRETIVSLVEETARARRATVSEFMPALMTELHHDYPDLFEEPDRSDEAVGKAIELEAEHIRDYLEAADRFHRAQALKRMIATAMQDSESPDLVRLGREVLDATSDEEADAWARMSTLKGEADPHLERLAFLYFVKRRMS